MSDNPSLLPAALDGPPLARERRCRPAHALRPWQRVGDSVTLADIAAALLFVGVVAYAIFGGADFGTGVWDLLGGDAPADDKVAGENVVDWVSIRSGPQVMERSVRLLPKWLGNTPGRDGKRGGARP